MDIIRRYAMPATGAHYAQVALDDGMRVELKIVAEAEPTDADFLALAAEYVAATTPEPTIVVVCEDGYNA